MLFYAFSVKVAALLSLPIIYVTFRLIPLYYQFHIFSKLLNWLPVLFSPLAFLALYNFPFLSFVYM
uniref:Uncharacterized protein n=1 Tax=Arundo donax TaxID=35708 RepID=A0A0A9AU26_ARUDO